MYRFIAVSLICTNSPRLPGLTFAAEGRVYVGLRGRRDYKGKYGTKFLYCLSQRQSSRLCCILRSDSTVRGFKYCTVYVQADLQSLRLEADLIEGDSYFQRQR